MSSPIAWVFVIGLQPIGGVSEQCEFMVYDERLATLPIGLVEGH
jgi:hypothetical protein